MKTIPLLNIVSLSVLGVAAVLFAGLWQLERYNTAQALDGSVTTTNKAITDTEEDYGLLMSALAEHCAQREDVLNASLHSRLG